MFFVKKMREMLDDIDVVEDVFFWMMEDIEKVIVGDVSLKLKLE